MLTLGVAFRLDAEAAKVPVPALREGGDGPVGGVQDQVGAGVAGLEREGGVAEENDAEHEHQGGEQGEDAVDGHSDDVLALFRMPVELACDLLVAFDDQKCATGIDDHDIGWRNGSFRIAFLQSQLPPVAEPDQRRQA